MLSEDRTHLNIADLCMGTRALGPGLRAAIWVQGCPIHCVGCIAPDWIPFKKSHLLTPEDAAERLLQRDDIEGITISGGEPMVQAAGLADMLRFIRRKRNLHIICFTGFRYETLLKWDKTKKIRPFLSELDVLIDGPYIEKLNNGQTFPGSANQRIIDLSNKPLPGDQTWHLRRMEYHLRERNILTVGIPPKEWVKEPFIETTFGLHQNLENKNERL